MTSSNYQINLVDLDSTYIPGNDPNYIGIQAAVTNRKTVVFGQQLLTQTYPVGNLNNAINYAQTLPAVMIDQDSTTITGVGPTSVFYKNRANAQSLIRASFNLAENYPQTNQYQVSNLVQGPIQNNLFPNYARAVLPNTGISINEFSMQLLSNGTLWSVGVNSFGSTGLNTSASFTWPSSIGTTSTWTQVSCGYYYSIALQTPGTLWSWGNNSFGQLGLSNQTHRSSPVQVGTLNTWTQVAGGNLFTLARQTNGTLWAWGFNNVGQLGLNDVASRSSPVQVGALSVWAQVVIGTSFSYAIQSNGTLWSWGSNDFGALGINTASAERRSSPVQVGSLSVWTQVSGGTAHILALQSNGTLWACGYNGRGQLGVNTSTLSYSSPVQIGSLSTWTQVAAAGNYSLAIQTPGTLWAWGRNDTFQLGLSNTVDRSSPVQVGVLSIWTRLFPSGGSNSFAATTGGTLYAWGSNNFGQLGFSPGGISATKQVYGL
jgi:alpha-tubulin suppressor-like RCC1 family protein